MRNPRWTWSIGMGVSLMLVTACTMNETDAQVTKPATVREIQPLQTINPLGAKYYHHLTLVSADLLLLRYVPPDQEKVQGGCLALWDRKQDQVVWKQTSDFNSTPSVAANDKLLIVPRQDNQ